MEFATIVNLILAVLSFILCVISIIVSVATLKQNSRMIENSTRPYISIYGQEINTGVSCFYLVVRNFGQSPAVMTKFSAIPTLSNCYKVKNSRDFLADLSNAVIAPGQSRICALDYSNIPEQTTFDIVYESSGKEYKEKFTINLKASTAMLITKHDKEGSELHSISYTLQEMLQKNL